MAAAVRRLADRHGGSRDSARQLNDKGNEAAALTCLGGALREVRRFEEAVSALQDAIAIFRETGDRHSEGLALVGLGLVLVEVQHLEGAIEAHRAAVAIFRETDDQYWEDIALGNLERYRAAQATKSESR